MIVRTFLGLVGFKIGNLVVGSELLELVVPFDVIEAGDELVRELSRKASIKYDMEAPCGKLYLIYSFLQLGETIPHVCVVVSCEWGKVCLDAK